MLQHWLIVGLPLVATVLWHIVDSAPSLWLYDLTVHLSPQTFANQTIWVTGASSGIGAAVVCQLSRGGARHVILSARRVEQMHQVIRDCQESTTPGKEDDDSTSTTTFSVVPYDALDVKATHATVQSAILSAPSRSIDVLILNSGIYQLRPALETTAEERRKLWRVNWEAPVDLSQVLIEQDGWKERGRGHLVVVSSIAAKGPQSLLSTYGATKAALRNYFQSLSTEEFAWLKVHMILPGATASDLWKTNFQESTTQVLPDAGALMTTERVAELIVKAIAGPYWLFYEVWISKPLGLVYVWMSHYTPTLFYVTNHIMGTVRVTAFRAYSGRDMLEMSALLHLLGKIILGYDAQ